MLCCCRVLAVGCGFGDYSREGYLTNVVHLLVCLCCLFVSGVVVLINVVVLLCCGVMCLCCIDL